MYLCGRVATRCGQNVLKAAKFKVVTIFKTKQDRAMVTAKCEYEVIDCLSFAMVIGIA